MDIDIIIKTENINNAIEGLKMYMEAISKMDVNEFDYCYNELVKQNISHFQITRYLNSLIAK
jgi:hypothetical protein